MKRLSLHLDAFSKIPDQIMLLIQSQGFPKDGEPEKKSSDFKISKIWLRELWFPNPHDIQVQVNWGTWLVLHCYV